MFSIENLTEVLSKLPGIGKKSATRLTYYFLKNPHAGYNLIESLAWILQNVGQCKKCGQFTTDDMCDICTDNKRDSKCLCIIEEQNDMLAIEQTGTFKGLYHILMGSIDPLSGKGPEKLKISELIKRIQSEPIEDILIATNPTVEGEATFLYLKTLILQYKNDMKISKLATGIPMGGSLEYSDKLTLTKAILTKQYQLG